ncbi:unnamed protein product [Ixodes pacificus]
MGSWPEASSEGPVNKAGSRSSGDARGSRFDTSRPLMSTDGETRMPRNGRDGGTSDQNANNRRRPAAFSRNAALSARLQAPLRSKDCHARTGHQLRLSGDSHGAPKQYRELFLYVANVPQSIRLAAGTLRERASPRNDCGLPLGGPASFDEHSWNGDTSTDIN